jgi:excisionase family DNA binding protein
MSEQLLTVDEAAAALKLHAQTVREHLKAGKLRGIKRGSVWRIPESALSEPEPQPIAPQTDA